MAVSGGVAGVGTGSRLRVVLQEFNRDRSTGGMTPLAALLARRPTLVEAAELARSSDRDRIPTVINLIYVLIDVATGRVAEPVADPALRGLEEEVERSGWSTTLGKVLEPALLRGPELRLDPAPRAGLSMMRFQSFLDYYAADYGGSPFDPDHADELWESIEDGALSVPAGDLRIDGAWNVVWFTEGEQLQASGEAIDGDWAYDALGLDWSGHWDAYPAGPDDASRARAVALSVPLAIRALGSGGLRVPTAFDAWGFLGFTPRGDAIDDPWPAGGGKTVNPLTGHAGPCEAVHGKVSVPKGSVAPVRSCGMVRRKIPSRLEECGDAILDRALARLSAL